MSPSASHIVLVDRRGVPEDVRNLGAEEIDPECGHSRLLLVENVLLDDARRLPGASDRLPGKGFGQREFLQVLRIVWVMRVS